MSTLDNFFETSEKITCDNITTLDKSKNIGVFASRTMDCSAFANERGYQYNIEHNNFYPSWDRFIYNKCNPYSKAQFGLNNTKLQDCNGFECNDDKFLIKPQNKHTYKNGIHYDCEKNRYCSYHQVFNNIKGHEEVKQYVNKADCFGPVDDSMSGCKAIKFLHPYSK